MAKGPTKVVILAGGWGSRLAEETESKPKPMVEVGGRPLLWHVMKHYAHFGFTEFLIPVGYKGEVIKRFFLDYSTLQSDFTVGLRGGQVRVHEKREDLDDWTVHVVDTGLATMTGGRLKRLEPFLRGETFMLTYGDGLSAVDLDRLLEFHRKHGGVATVTAVRPPARFGALVFEGDKVVAFEEKAQLGEGWINGGFMVLEPEVFRHLVDDGTSLEAHTLHLLAAQGQLRAWRHEGFWQCVDTLRELRLLQQLWADGQAPWKVWP
ncbi:MAG TPA: glucose-1-phosphate cytidylyltransferase [Vicinamibacteria bacterium]|nr:glucose-1-phosphate cytidylyltransferase [Vicinamibacteria bacterium]